MPTYSETKKENAAETYRTNGRNLAAVARLPGMPSDRTLRSWKKTGVPESLTGGDDWDVWADRKDARVSDAESKAAVERSNREDLTWVEAEKERIEGLMEEAYEQLTSESGEQITAAQYVKLSELYLRLDNLSKDKLEWMQAKFADILVLVMDIVSEQQFAKLQAKMKQMHARETEKLPTDAGEDAGESAFGMLPYEPEADHELAEPEELALAVEGASDG